MSYDLVSYLPLFSYRVFSEHRPFLPDSLLIVTDLFPSSVCLISCPGEVLPVVVLFVQDHFGLAKGSESAW